LLPKRNFNLALLSLAKYIQDIHWQLKTRDPSLQLPYNLTDKKIDNYVVAYAQNDRTWVVAMKMLLSDLKWSLAWLIKQSVINSVVK